MEQWSGSVVLEAEQTATLRVGLQCTQDPVLHIQVDVPDVEFTATWTGATFDIAISSGEDFVSGYSVSSGPEAYQYSLSFVSPSGGTSAITVTLEQEGAIVEASVSVVEV